MSVHVHTLWCSGMFDLLEEGGIWGVPRSGLVFQKQVDPPTLLLTDRMPHIEGMPITPEELREMQDAEFAQIRDEFAKAGITVTEEVSM